MKVYTLHSFKGEFFRILETTPDSQLGVMTVKPGKDSGPEEVHEGDQVIYVIEGEAEVLVASEKGIVRAGDAVIVPRGARHHLWNKKDTDLFFLTLYAPPAY